MAGGGKKRRDEDAGSGKLSGKASGQTGRHRSDRQVRVGDLLRVKPGSTVDLAAYDTRATPGGPPDKQAALVETALIGRRLGDLQGD